MLRFRTTPFRSPRAFLRGLWRTRSRLEGPLLLALGVLAAAPLRAQSGEIFVRNEVFVGSEIEEYLRLLQITGDADLYPWTIRSFSPPEVDRLLPDDSVHPWAARYDLRPDTASGLRVHLVRPELRAIFNSAFPFGGNDGAIWAGRGITTALRVGGSLRYGPLSLLAAPVVFHSQNADFDLMDNGLDGRLAYANGTYPLTIDFPQRFGDGAVTRIDPGQSTARLDLYGVTAGISTANQEWGPAGEYPILLGSNAPGFFHGFLGTASPWNVWLGEVHGRLVWGRLDQSDFAVLEGRSSRRFMSGIVGSFTPRGLPGLEIGGARFFHTPWPADGLDAGNFLKPVEAFWKSNLPDREEEVIPGDTKSDVDNQLASAFFRAVFPRSGFEVYGEYGREDHSFDARDFVLEPDHSGGYMLGFQKAWMPSGDRLVALRGEVLDLGISHIARVRHQAPFYVHGFTVQGHTQRGQLLGAAAGLGGMAATLAADVYGRGGRWTAAWTREVRQDRGSFPLTGVSDDRGLDVLHTLGLEGLFFRGRFDITAGLRGAYEFNRDFGDDAFNVNANLGLRAAF